MICAICGTERLTNEDGFCGCCEWDVRAQVMLGLRNLEAYLKKYDRYQAWCLEHRVAA